ncbi:MAG: PTS sugar transporter subunit IIA [Kiritimatiellae bacterium]|nr:PTS sugar transporter subunit IIA [Kiritimatiellia bacterium]MDD3440153.1 PTS sugar transporter subunit IIA [Kiritimatiellia bacterium]MDD4116965.1 PTS sugar transporter subunit IIA [Kiritimatiellia bacterium]HOO20131.1 PTS sugar transporter subunit IIA [Kiritimatiellia bacterium]HPJ56247.1 PTS sugar transporter subunit IIA [Kiritimatiellia bacterium]
MQPIINHLVQLQELIIARAQQEAGMPGAQFAQLDESIHALTQELPRDIHQQFTRLLQKSPLAIVPVVNGVCTACGMTLPVSLVHQVHAAEQIYQCPSCARLLFHRASGARNTRKSPRRSDPPKVGIERFSAESLMIPALKGTDRDAVLAELCQKLDDEGFVDDAGKLLEAAEQREAIISTAVENGLAFPHVRCVEGGALTFALGIAPKGIKFDPAGKANTRIIFFMVIPTAASAFYLKLLSGLSQVFQKAENREKLLEAETSEKMWKALVKATRLAIS